MRILQYIAGVIAVATVFYGGFKTLISYDLQIKELRKDVTILQQQSELYEQAIHRADAEKSKIEEEYAEKKEQLQQAISSNDLFNTILPDDVLKLLKEESRRANTVSPPSNPSR